eukprot:15471834-Alexandrium_andersonii.AAC.1
MAALTLPASAPRGLRGQLWRRGWRGHSATCEWPLWRGCCGGPLRRWRRSCQIDSGEGRSATSHALS